MPGSTISSVNGYDIPHNICWTGQDRIILVCHGFGSSKMSPMVQALNETLPSKGIGVVSFDFPAHGESPTDDLRLPACLDDLQAMENAVRAMVPGAALGYFGSSFGAYVTLLYLATRPHAGKQAFLRSAAVTMPRLVRSWVDDKAMAEMREKGYFVPDYDYVREIRGTPAFLHDLDTHDVFTLYRKGLARLRMVHGARDDVAPPEDAQRFARQFDADLHLFPNGEHSLMGPGELDEVLTLAVDFFAPHG